jgi:hypothetical protein
MIIVDLGESVYEYDAHEERLLSTQHVCPICDNICHRHGSYARHVRVVDRVIVITLLRVRCLMCAITHAVLPSFLPPYGRYPVEAREAVVTQQAAGVPVEAAGAGFGQAVETSKRWIASFRRKISAVLGALRGALAKRGMFRNGGDEPPLFSLSTLCADWLGAGALPLLRAGDRSFAWANLILCDAVARLWL